VQSIEDHGYVMDVGLPDVRCFMPKKKGSDDEDDKEELAVGQVVQANVTQCQVDGTVATLTLSLKHTVKIKQNVELNVSTLTPGTKVHVNVTKVNPPTGSQQVRNCYSSTSIFRLLQEEWWSVLVI
jgi:rRNA biogenesis protein RRP5